MASRVQWATFLDGMPRGGRPAFPTVSPEGAPDPVLFVAPSYQGALPEVIERIEVRRLTPNGIAVQLPQDRNVMAGMRWATP